MKLGPARSIWIALALACATTAAAQPPECAGLPENNVIDLVVKPVSFKDSAATPDGYDQWAMRGQFVPFTSFEIDLGAEQNITLFLMRSSDDAELYSKTLGPNDFETYGSASNKWRHSIKKRDAEPGDTWRVARIRTSKAVTAPAFLNRLTYGFKGVFEPPVDLLDDEDAPLGMRVTFRIEPTDATCEEEPSRCLCATYPLACTTPGRNGTFKCFSGPN